MRARVVLPAPERPTRETISPLYRVRSMFASTFCLPKDLLRFRQESRVRMPPRLQESCRPSGSLSSSGAREAHAGRLWVQRP